MALFIQACRVDGLEEHLQQETEADHFGVVVNMNRLHKPRRVGIDFLIGRGLCMSVTTSPDFNGWLSLLFHKLNHAHITFESATYNINTC